MAASSKSSKRKITISSTAEYFAKNLQQVGFSSPTKAVLTTLKEALDNALDACEENNILPNLHVLIKKVGKGSTRNTDKILIRVEDNGPGIDIKDIPMVFGQYLASSKFGRGRCSRGQQGIGISAATTWAQQTSATGARVITKRANQRKALSCLVVTDLKNNKGILKEKESIDTKIAHGTIVEFLIDGRLQLKGEGGLLTYLRGSVLLNPHLTLNYTLPDIEPTSIDRVVEDIPLIPEATAPHLHTMQLGEFISYARLSGRKKLNEWLKTCFSRVTNKTIQEIKANFKSSQAIFNKSLISLTPDNLKELFNAIHEANILAPSTQSVMSIGERALSLSILRLGKIDYFSVVTRNPTVCDFKPVQVEVAIARLKDKTSEQDSSVQVLRFANRVPLQFDKSACAIVKSIISVNWKSYGLKQAKNSLPVGNYIFAVSVVSPFIKFKNASKETIDASDELVDELRKSLMKAGQGLAKHLKRESKAQELESKIEHIEKFSPILVDTLCRVLSANDTRRKKAEAGIIKLLEKDNLLTHKQLDKFEQKLKETIGSHESYISSFDKEDKLMEDK